MKRLFHSWLALGTLCSILATPVLAQNSPGDTVRIVVPFAPGGPSDFVTRQIARPLAQELDKNVIIDNRPGASGNIGAKHVVDARPDGLTLVLTTASMQAINPILFPDAGYMPSQDLIPVGIIGALPNVLVVHPGSNIDSVKQLVEKGSAPGASLNFATFGPTSSPHFYGSLLRHNTGISASPVAYKGSGHAIVDMLAGRLDFTFDSMSTSVTHVNAGKLKGLAITAKERSPLLPDVPTLKETGYGGDVEPTFWMALQVAKGTDESKMNALRQAIYKALQDDEFSSSVAARGVEILDITPETLDDFVQKDTAVWIEAAHAIGIKPE
ncbi:tripartite tricarboxylate transporter substrate binding protein [Alcaligenaceae bacterium]|nr:tripartite tricarboxylate transporter substrate binding protein [Alcaligenaceae bacterium]